MWGQPHCVHRARFICPVRKNCLDHRRVFDTRNDAHRAAASCAGFDVDAKTALHLIEKEHSPVRPLGRLEKSDKEALWVPPQLVPMSARVTSR